MRIAVVSPNRNAWSETFIAAHIERLPDVALVLTDGHLPRRDGKGVPLLRSDVLARASRRVAGRTPEEALRRRLAVLLRRERIDVVLAEYGPTGEAMLPVCEAAGIPLVAHFHGVDAFHEDLLARHAGYARLVKGAAAIVVVSREMEDQLLALGAPRVRLHYNCYGVDQERFTIGAPAEAPPVFIGLGRFVDKKAPHLTVLTFAEALKQEPSMRLLLAGQGPLWDATHQLVRALGIGDRVELPGVLPHEAIAQRMRGARAFVQHSVVTHRNDHEGTPLAVLEAMATGLPVVATRHAGIPDVVEHEVHGLLSAERDLGAMATHLVRLARDPALAGRMGAAARGRILAGHAMTDRIDALAAILRQAVGMSPACQRP